VVILESEEHALARGARIYAVAAGAGYSSDAHHISLGAPDGEGVAFAINAAMRDAGISPGQVVHINAHATSTPGGDPLEARAIEAALGSDASHVVVSATKSMTGHLLGGAGAIETVAAILALRDRVAPPTINLEDPDDDIVFDIATKPRPLAPRTADAPMAVLNDAFGFGGHNVALAFTEYVAPSSTSSTAAEA
jgi:3-oxoacyl-[acyl-carrier-protein] synthase II